MAVQISSEASFSLAGAWNSRPTGTPERSSFFQ